MDSQQPIKSKKEDVQPYDYKADVFISLISLDENEIEKALRILQKNSKIVAKHSKEIEDVIVDNLFDFYQTKFIDGFNRMLKIFEILKKLQVNFVYYDIYFTSFTAYAYESLLDLSKHAQQNWKNIPALILERYLNIFNIQSQIDPKEIEKQINYLMLIKKVSEAIKIFTIFNMRKHMNMYDLLERIISQERTADAILLVQPDETDLQKYLIEVLTEKSYIDKCIELISQYNLRYQDFPQLIQKMERKSIEKVLPSPKDWEKAEERIHTNKNILCYLVEILVSQGMINEAYSIVKRHNLQEVPYFQTEIKKICGDEYIPNRILEKDGYGPTEEICLGELEGMYLHFKTFNIKEEDIIFINDLTSQKEIFDEAKKNIFSSLVVGFDSEFASQWNKFEKGGISTLQLAIKDKIYIFDAIALLRNQYSQEFVDFCRELFESPDIVKVGHSISTDLNEMDKTFNTDKKFNLNGFVDIAILNREIFSLANTASLKFMTQKLLNFNMSKSEQISNWDKRPLRKTQLHYAGLDAYLVLELYEKLVQIEKAGGVLNYVNVYQEESKDSNVTISKIKQNLVIIEENKIYYTKENEHFFRKKKTTQIKFLIDNMLYKLVKYLRNSGIDAAYINEKDIQLLQDLSLREERIIITRDNKFFNMKKNVPVYLLQENFNTEEQYNELIEYFKIDTSKLRLLSRCVKCNNNGIVIISTEEAKKFLNFSDPSCYKLYEYWQCIQCKQVYWEGETYSRSQKRFEDLTTDKKNKKDNNKNKNK